MQSSSSERQNDEVLVVAPGGRDCDVIRQMLSTANIESRADPDGRELNKAIAEGAGAGAIITELGLSRIDLAGLKTALDQQPPWSDFPFLLLSRRGETLRQGYRPIEQLGNVTILERPLHAATLVAASAAAVRARGRQRLAQAHLQRREAAEEALRELASTLEQKVGERTRELAAANDRLTAEIAERERVESQLLQSQKMDAIGQLTGGIAHDFNNLLTAVIGALDLLVRRTTDERLVRLAKSAMQGADRGAKLTSQLLAFSQRQCLTPRAVDANQVINQMADLLARTLGAQIAIDMRLEPDLWGTLVDPTQLEVALLNLAINARDAMPAGGQLTIKTRNADRLPERLATGLKAESFIAVSVRDSGLGMTPNVLARAFEPFFTTKAHGRGTGLGLSQVYGFTKQSGGTVVIDSQQGKGAEITLYLPRTDCPALIEQDRIQIDAAAAPARVLLVDDDDVRSIATSMLEEIGYCVTSCEDGREAIERLRAERFDALLTDVAMPGMNGLELARRVRELAPGLPIIFSSGYAEIDYGDEILDGKDFIKKPYRMYEVAERIAGALGKSSRMSDAQAALGQCDAERLAKDDELA